MNFLELEKKCKRRRIRVRVLYALAGLFVVGAVGVSYFVIKHFLLEDDTKKEVVSIQKEPLVKKEPLKEVKEIKEKVVEVKKEKKEEKKPIKRVEVVDKNVIYPQMFREVSNEKMRDDVFIKPELFIKSKSDLEIKNSSANSSNKVLHSKPVTFKECIKKANYYYNHKDYIKALEWAKNANLIDKEHPASWIITAKALNKLGKKDEALTILKIYYSYHKDKEVKKLIGELENE